MSGLAIAILILYVAAGIGQHYEYKRLGRKVTDFSPAYVVLSFLLEMAFLALAVWTLV